MNNLKQVDLNLLVTLHALMIEKHISRTATRLHKSQPAISHALAHLRKIFNDPLLVRSGARLELTPRATELMQPLSEALHQLGALLEPPRFDPSDARQTFRLAMSDYGARVVLPRLVRLLREQALGIDIAVGQATREVMQMQVLDGEIDLALGVFPTPPSGLYAQTLFEESFACVADAASLPPSGGIALDAWLERPHALVAMRGGMDNEIDRALARLNRRRRIAVMLPHWGVANELIAGTDLILTVARRNLDHADFERVYGSCLRVFDPPFAIESFEFRYLWHERRHSDPAHRWLRGIVARLLQER